MDASPNAAALRRHPCSRPVRVEAKAEAQPRIMPEGSRVSNTNTVMGACTAMPSHATSALGLFALCNLLARSTPKHRQFCLFPLQP